MFVTYTFNKTFLLCFSSKDIIDTNRWYDKTLQMIVCEDGNIGLTYEHSVSEGIAVKSLVENLLNNMLVLFFTRLRKYIINYYCFLI